jgi:enoyl-CoA hydratase
MAMSETFSTIRLAVSDRVATITLNRPDCLNAINDVMRRELTEACDELAGDPLVNVVVLKGSGRAFCSGHDVKDASAIHPGDTAYDWTRVRKEQEFLWKIWDLPRPVIAQVHGHAVGVGSILMTMCDLVVISDDARVGNSQIVDGAGMMGPRYVWAIGLRRAKWLDLLPAWWITGREAVDWGWANLAVPASELEGEVNALAAQLASVPLTQLMLRKTSLNQVAEQMGFRASATAGLNFLPIAHKSDHGQEIDAVLAKEGFFSLAARMLTSFPKRHNRAPSDSP